MSDYTPTTGEVLAHWDRSHTEYGAASLRRWLASVKAEAWEQGYDAAPLGGRPRQENPYREQEVT